MVYFGLADYDREFGCLITRKNDCKLRLIYGFSLNVHESYFAGRRSVTSKVMNTLLLLVLPISLQESLKWHLEF
jgi:hypothetical protein